MNQRRVPLLQAISAAARQGISEVPVTAPPSTPAPTPSSGFSLPHVEAPAAEPSEAGHVCHAVSRHGFEEYGVTCLQCGQVAARPGDWTAVHETFEGEMVKCPHCGALLFASPDDAIDPIVAGAEYDKSVYHFFVRPEGWRRPKQQYESRDPVEGDWVVFLENTTGNLHGKEQRLDWSEGRVDSIKGKKATVFLVGSSAIASVALPSVEVPLSQIRPMAFDIFRPGQMVEIWRGPHQGKVGTYVSGCIKNNRHSMEIEVDGTVLYVPIEHVRKSNA